MKNTIGIIGLGKMGTNLALNAIDKGYNVLGFDKFLKNNLSDEGINVQDSLDKMVSLLPSPKIVFIYIPAGIAIDELLKEITPLLGGGDIIVDGGNSYWGDSITRASLLQEKGIHFIDCGTSGGVNGARNGACFMAGGDERAIKYVAPILTDLAVENGFIYTGGSGSGHFVKLVHNGIEFGMLQAIGEGMALLEHYREQLSISAILKVWNHGSVIRSWLIDLMKQVYDDKNGFEAVPFYIEDTGEVNWLVADAMRMEVPVPVIAQSVMQLFASRDNQHIAHRAVAMMRHGFGGHPFGEDKGIQHERKFGKVSNNTDNIYYEK
jgi:6-phosphogluconate dehydrogenase